MSTRATGDRSPLWLDSRDAWAAWLGEHHADSDGVWLALGRKGAGAVPLTYADALEVAICFGWIDAQKDKLDETRWLQRFTPRRARSRWSKVNCAKATALIEAGEMRPAGLAEVERARADGRWAAAYDGARTATVPPDLEAELGRSPTARAFFEALDSANRYAILYRLQEAKRPETRARRLQTFVAMLEQGRKIHP